MSGKVKHLCVIIFFISSVFCLLSHVFASDVPATMSYTGFVKSNGIVYNGTGYFKFKIVNSDGSFTYWSNDGTHEGADTVEPNAAVSTTVSSGVFNIILGDTAITNMTALHPADFTNGITLYLRTWFSANGATFELLTADKQLTSSAYAFAVQGGRVDKSSPYFTSLGYQAGDNNTGSCNSFFGYYAGKNNITGSGNTAVGFGALYNSSTINCNTAVGYCASQLAVGQFNTTIGYSAGSNITTGACNTCVGDRTYVSAASDTYETVIGSEAVGSGSSSVTLGRANHGDKVYIPSLTSNGTVYSNGHMLTNTDPSDLRLKNNIISFGDALNKIMLLNPVSFQWKETGEKSQGFIAQEMEEILPELVGQDSNGYKGIYTTKLIPYLVKAIQEQENEITELRNEIEEQKNQINELKHEIKLLRQKIQK